MPDVCGTKKASVPQSGGCGFTKVGFLFLQNAAGQALSHQYIIQGSITLKE